MKSTCGKLLSFFLCFAMLFTSFPITFSNRLGNDSYENVNSEKVEKGLEVLGNLEESKIEYESLTNNFNFIPNIGKYDDSVLWYGSFGTNMVFVDDTNTITYLLPEENTTDNQREDIFYSEMGISEEADKPFKAWVLKEQFINSKSNAIDQIYRPGGITGDGGLADAIRHQLLTGELIGGKDHLKKGWERLKNLENIINKQDLNSSDLDLAQKLYKDLANALGGK